MQTVLTVVWLWCAHRPQPGSTGSVPLATEYVSALLFAGGGNLTVRYTLHDGANQAVRFFDVTAVAGPSVVTLAHVTMADSYNYQENSGPLTIFEGSDMRISDASIARNRGAVSSCCHLCDLMVA